MRIKSHRSWLFDRGRNLFKILVCRGLYPQRVQPGFAISHKILKLKEYQCGKKNQLRLYPFPVAQNDFRSTRIHIQICAVSIWSLVYDEISSIECVNSNTFFSLEKVPVRNFVSFLREEDFDVSDRCGPRSLHIQINFLSIRSLKQHLNQIVIYMVAVWSSQY